MGAAIKKKNKQVLETANARRNYAAVNFDLMQMFSNAVKVLAR